MFENRDRKWKGEERSNDKRGGKGEGEKREVLENRDGK